MGCDEEGSDDEVQMFFVTQLNWRALVNRLVFMGYTTEFTGSIGLSRCLTLKEAKYLMDRYDDNALFEKESGIKGYLQWVPSCSLDAIVWDQNEKFYNYIESMEWVCRWLYSIDVCANGSLFWRGENGEDIGTIKVQRNIVSPERIEVFASLNKVPLTLRDLQKMALEKLIGE